MLGAARGQRRCSAVRKVTQRALPAAYYRGDVSLAIIFEKHNLPRDEKISADIFPGVINFPDPNGRQLHGLGGSVSSLSKVSVVSRCVGEDVGVDYIIAAVKINKLEVEFSSNCGNMIAAIGPFAVDSGLVMIENSNPTLKRSFI